MENLQNLNQEYKKLKTKIEERLNEFKQVPKENYFYEAAFCILTPQSKAHNCWSVVEKLKENNFQNKNINPKSYLRKGYVRFHNNKSQYLIELKEKFPEILEAQEKINNNKQLREFLVKNIKGWGLKEASHYLRNVGKENLAILDRHILKNLHKHEAIQDLPKSLNKNKYHEIEASFLNFSKKVNIPLDHLDLLFWANETGEIFK